MAYTKQDLMKLEGAEVVGGNIIHGTLGNRVFVGKISEEGVFFITPEGEARLKALEEGPGVDVEPAPAKIKSTKAKAKASMVAEEDDIAAAIAQAE
jgi:hypothetical protein